MYQNPWILQELIRHQQRSVAKGAAPARLDPSRPMRRFLRARWVLAAVRASVAPKPAAQSPGALRVDGALHRAR